MKNIAKYTIAALLTVGAVSCTDLDELNVSPNSPQSVPSNMVMCGAEKWTVDNIYDNWFSGRQCLPYSQQIGQRNYTEEDRYQVRESVNNNYFKYLYMALANFQNVIDLNTDPATATLNSAYGDNQNQIAAARIMKVWLFEVITDTWGDVPYSEALKLVSEGKVYAKYDDQKSIYAGLIKELTEAAAQINEEATAFVSGDVIFDGDASKWKKFANSLKCRLAIHLSKVDPNWKTYIAEALASGVMESNDDAAKFKYSTAGSEYSMFYEGFYVDGRNDLTILKPFVDILKGEPDALNQKSHPWQGVIDPRLQMYTTPAADGEYRGIPYAAPTGIQAKFASSAPNWYKNPPIVLAKDYAVPLMTYAELQFILCEYNNFDPAYYKAGIEASINYWGEISGVTASSDDIKAYIDAVSANVNAESCAIQKYIDLYTNGTEAWNEIRRTGYPEQLIRPGEIVGVLEDGTEVKFSPLNDTKGDIIARVKYPVIESTLNGSAFKEAVEKLNDGSNNYYTKMYWDVRKSSYDHPNNL
ncbi:MAG: SusD/RagB family nutrient-binding outer membrane lipoprotein [Bacteroidales bacterium]|nr:SusD/RagB family nutrient-binding outer membrane lipoprotein [Bacteroidales bacterium]